MVDFLLCILQYVLIMGVLAVIAFGGIKLGIKLRQNKNAKTVTEAEDAAASEDK